MGQAILTPEQLERLHAHKERHREDFLPRLLIIFGTVSLGFIIVYLFFVTPRLLGLYRDIGVSVPVSLYIVLVVESIYPIALLYDAFYLKKIIKREGTLSNKQKITGLLLLIIGGFSFFGFGIGLLILNTILPIYNMTTTF